MSVKCDPIRKELQSLYLELADTPMTIGGDGPGPIVKPRPNPIYRELQRKVVQAQARLRLCEGETPTPRSGSVTIAVQGIKCVEATDGFFLERDEPYVVVVAMKIGSVIPATKIPPIPGVFPEGLDIPEVKIPWNIEATLYGPWQGVGTGDERTTVPIPASLPEFALDSIPIVWRRSFWGIDRHPAKLTSTELEGVVFLVAVLENDGASPNGVRSLIKSLMLGSTTAMLGMNLTRDELVSRLCSDMNGHLENARRTGGVDFDEVIDGTKELKVTPAHVESLASGNVNLSLHFQGQGGRYKVEFVMSMT